MKSATISILSSLESNNEVSVSISRTQPLMLTSNRNDRGRQSSDILDSPASCDRSLRQCSSAGQPQYAGKSGVPMERNMDFRNREDVRTKPCARFSMLSDKIETNDTSCIKHTFMIKKCTITPLRHRQNWK